MNRSIRGTLPSRTVCAVLGLTLLLVLLPAFVAQAQSTSADIVGTVRDASGAAVPDATVSVANLGTNAKSSVITDASGNYTVSSLPPGRYTVRIEHTGFKSWTATELTLNISDRRRIDAQLVVGDVSQAVEVVAQGASLQTDSSTISTVVTAKAVQDLPLNGRNFITLAQVVAGANDGPPNSESSGLRPDDRRQSTQVSVNGQGSQVNSQMIDGIDNNERFIGNIGVRPSMDGVEEFRVQTNLYTAEVGRTAGAVINLVTKSGTNEFHGSLFEFIRNDKLDANDYFANAARRPLPKYRQNQFGGSIGGPIVRDKTFFFVDYEALRFIQGLVYTSQVPTAAEKNGDFTGLNTIYDPTTTPRQPFPDNKIPSSMFNPIAVKYLATLPDPTSPGLANNFITTSEQTYYMHTGDIRVDHRFNNANVFYGRYTVNNLYTYFPGSLPAVNGIYNAGNAALSSGPFTGVNHGVQLHYLHTFRPNLIGELKASYLRFNNDQEPMNTGTPPSALGIKGADNSVTLTQMVLAPYATLGDASFVPTHRIANNYNYAGTMNWVRGPHTLKWGGGIVFRQEADFRPPGGGSYSFSNLATNNPAVTNGVNAGDAIASFLLGFPTAGGTRSYNLATIMQSYHEPQVFFQDDWRATRWLTLNIGLRYDIYSLPTERNNQMVNLNLNTLQYVYANDNGVNSRAGVMTNHGDIGPRFGFAATLGHEFVVRGGYGISYFPGNTGTQYLGAGPRTAMATPAVTPTVVSGLSPNLFLADGFPPTVAQPPYTPINAVGGTNWHFPDSTVQQFNLTVEKAISDYIFSASYVGLLSRHLAIQNFPLNNAPVGPGAIQQRRPYYPVLPAVQAINIFMAIGVSNYNGLQLNLTRRLNHGLTLNTNYTFAKCLSDSIQIGQSNPSFLEVPDIRHNDYGRCDNDIRQRWAMTANYGLPLGKSLKGVVKALAADWQLNAVAAYQTGLPFSVYNNSALSNTGAANDRPNLVTDPGAINSSVGQWFNTAAFQAQPAFTLGNSGRNILTGPPARHLDLSVFKMFNLNERMRVQFRAEGFNVTNTPNFALPNAAINTPGFGSISRLQYLTTPRQIQLALKLLF
jgi:hypothetical protein